MHAAIKYTPEIADQICDHVSAGGTITDICKQIGIDRTIVYDWIKREEPEFQSFALRFARAKDAGYEAIAEDCLTIADDGTNDTIKTEKGDFEDKEWTSRSKLRVETRLKLLAKWSPKKYGDRIAIESEDPNFTAEEREKRIAELLQRANGTD